MMCGRFYNDETVKTQLQSIIDEDESNIEHKDYYPSDTLSVIIGYNKKKVLKSFTWGYSVFQGKVINARCETLFEKKMFQEDIYLHRCIIPAKGFYEWDHLKHKISFENDDVIYMAGLYHENEVVIITTQANEVIKPIHSRMPLIISKEEINDWLFDNKKAFQLLKKQANNLKIKNGHIQQSLF